MHSITGVDSHYEAVLHEPNNPRLNGIQYRIGTDSAYPHRPWLQKGFSAAMAHQLPGAHDYNLQFSSLRESVDASGDSANSTCCGLSLIGRRCKRHNFHPPNWITSWLPFLLIATLVPMVASLVHILIATHPLLKNTLPCKRNKYFLITLYDMCFCTIFICAMLGAIVACVIVQCPTRYFIHVGVSMCLNVSQCVSTL